MDRLSIQSPEEFYGFEMGSDRKLARWDKIVEYFNLLGKTSNRIRVTELGKSTMGNPFILAVISSPKNLSKMDRLMKISSRLADPRGLSDENAERLIEEGKSVVAFTMGLHASEVAAAQMSSELAYEMVTSEDPEITKILDETVLLMFPSFNPDGQIMVVDWYNKWLGTEHEGVSLPWLYNKYTGHDDARDGFMLTQVEGRMFSRIVFRDWHAQAHVDFHQMGSYGARYYIPPYCDPINPHVDPTLWREHQLYGAQMAVKLEQGGKKGIESAIQYTGYWIPAFHLIANFHNCAGMITESASVRIASPIYIDFSQLQTPRIGRPEYKAATNFPNPWLGGWWRLRDLVEQQKISAYATLEIAANLKRSVLRSMYLKAKNNIDAGENESPYAYIIPREQHDPLTALKMLDLLILAGVEINRSEKAFSIGESQYPAGTHVIFLNQPLRSYVKTLLEQTFYPDNDYTRARDGSPLRPYDMTTYTLAEFMGVRAIPANSAVQGSLEKLKAIDYPQGEVLGESKYGYVLDCRYNDSITAVMRLLEKKHKVLRIDAPLNLVDRVLQPGAFLIPKTRKPSLLKDLKEISNELHIDFIPLKEKCASQLHEIEQPRIGLYQRYWGGNADEGWTRWILEKFEIPYQTIIDNDIKNGKLTEKCSVLILPSDSKAMITGEGREEEMKRRGAGMGGMALQNYPPEYRSGIGKEGTENLLKFVEAGGVLVALNNACDYVIDGFKLPVRNVLADLPPRDFYCPGSTIKVNVDISSPTAYGMPSETLILFFNSPAFTIAPSEHNENYKAVVRYPEERMLQSGWLIGERKLSNRLAMIDAKHGKGRVILIGFRPQHRAQTHGTFKLFFNSLLN